MSQAKLQTIFDVNTLKLFERERYITYIEDIYIYIYIYIYKISAKENQIVDR